MAQPASQSVDPLLLEKIMNLGNKEEMKSKPEFILWERTGVHQIVCSKRIRIHTGDNVT